MNWEIRYYKKVERDILEWPGSISAKFAKIIKLVEQHGPAEVGMPYVKAMGKGLFEIRVMGKDGIGRALFCNLVGKRVIILNAFIKKTEKTPARELELARKRMLEIKEIWKN